MVLPDRRTNIGEENPRSDDREQPDPEDLLHRCEADQHGHSGDTHPGCFRQFPGCRICGCRVTDRFDEGVELHRESGHTQQEDHPGLGAVQRLDHVSRVRGREPRLAKLQRNDPDLLRPSRFLRSDLDDHREGPVIDQFDLHVGSEDAGGHLDVLIS